MNILRRLPVLFPVTLSVIGLVLAALALFAGHKQNFMEHYAIARLNVSRLGYNILQASNDSPGNDDNNGGLLDDIKDAWNEIESEIIQEINEEIGHVADSIAEQLGIRDWYSLHVSSSCQGYFEPDALAKGPYLKVTSCTASQAAYRLDLDKTLNRGLELGPFTIGLDDLGWDDEIQKHINTLNDALLAVFIITILGIVSIVISIIAALGTFLLPDRVKLGVINLWSVGLAALLLILSSTVVTVGLQKGVPKLNEIGGRIGVQAQGGDRFLAVIWSGAGVMLIAAVFWAMRLHTLRRRGGLTPVTSFSALPPGQPHVL